MSSSLPWMKFTPQDWVQDTRALSPNAKAAWIDLICFMWCRDKEEQGTLTNRIDQFARMVGLLPDEMIEVIQEFQDFNICDVTPSVTQDVTQVVTLMSRRMSRDCRKRQLATQRKKKERAQKNTTRANSEKGETPPVTQDVTPTVTHDVTLQRIEDRDKSISPYSPPVGDTEPPSPKKKTSWTRKQLEGEVYESYPNFQTWWKQYPNRKGVRKAFESWVKLGLEFEEQIPLFKVLSLQKKDAQWKENEGQYIPHGSTYLNQRLYEDEPQEKSAAGTGGGLGGRFSHG